MRFEALLLLAFLFIDCKLTEASDFWTFAWIPGFGKLLQSSNASSTFEPTIVQNGTVDGNLIDVNGSAVDKRAIKNGDANSWEKSQVPQHCEDAILLPLARLKVVSPEKIIELITTGDLDQTCYRVSTTVAQVQKAIENCVGFPPDHLYKKLADGLQQFDQLICKDVKKDAVEKYTWKSGPKKRLVDYKECLNQLQDELHDCEGPADWFEKRNNTIACQFYNDIIDCNYVKAAMLCGKSAARMVRDFSDAIMRKVLTFHCKRSRAIPHVENPMLEKSAELKISNKVIGFSLAVSFSVLRF